MDARLLVTQPGEWVCLLRGGPGRTLITPTIVPEYPGSDSCERICIKFTPRWGPYIVHACLHAKSLKTCLTLCSSMDYTLPPRQAPLYMQFSRQEYWIGSPFPPPGDLPDPGTNPAFLASAALAGGFFTTSTTWADLKSSLHGDHPSRDYSKSYRALPWPGATEQGVVPVAAGE